MIVGLEDLLADTDQPGLPELRRYLGSLFGERSETGQVVGVKKLWRERVFRLKLDFGHSERMIVIKRFTPNQSQREKMVIESWLPAVGLGHFGPSLLGIVAASDGQCIWHVYEDLGDYTLEHIGGLSIGVEAGSARGFLTPLVAMPDTAYLSAAIDAIAHIHRSFAGHPLLAECRLYSRDLGAYHYASSVHDAIRCLRFLMCRAAELPPSCIALLDRLLRRMEEYLIQLPQRVRLVEEYGGPPTLLHGDLDTRNTLVRPTDNGLDVRLIDWDHMGVGPMSYDLSNFLLQFPVDFRWDILQAYLKASGLSDFVDLSVPIWNQLFDAAGRARLADCIVWRCISTLETYSAWAFSELAQIEDWCDQLRPVLPPD